jgi:hypothetical protein
MKTFLEIIPFGHVNETLLAKVDSWTRRLIELDNGDKVPPRISIFLWERTRDFEEFDAGEKAELGVVTGGESDFLATHEAWRGYPRIHISIEKIRDLPEEVVHGVVQHEVGHALLHGTSEFYQFRFSAQLQEAGRDAGLDLPMLQQLVYLLSVAIKDEEVIGLLSQLGVGLYQMRLLEYLLVDTEEEKQAWDMIRDHAALRLIGMAVFLKTCLPIETMAESGVPEAVPLIEKWEAAYSWLTDQERRDLRAFARFVIGSPFNNFQDRLEQAVMGLIGKTRHH